MRSLRPLLQLAAAQWRIPLQLAWLLMTLLTVGKVKSCSLKQIPWNGGHREITAYL